MKKFEFSLEKMLSYKEQLLSGEKLKLAELRSKLSRLIEIMAQLKQEYKRCNDELNTQVCVGLTPQQIFQRKAYLNALNEKIKQQNQFIKAMEIKVTEQVKVVVRFSQDVSTLEKLKERQYEEYKYAEGKEQELLIEEFVSNCARAN